MITNPDQSFMMVITALMVINHAVVMSMVDNFDPGLLMSMATSKNLPNQFTRTWFVPSLDPLPVEIDKETAPQLIGKH